MPPAVGGGGGYMTFRGLEDSQDGIQTMAKEVSFTNV